MGWSGDTPVHSMAEGSDPVAVADKGKVYTKDVATITELFYRDSAGKITQFTTDGKINAGALGTVPIAQGGTGQITAILAFNALSPVTTKGDIIVRGATNNVRLPVGADTFVLTADAAEASGMKWAAAGGGGVTGSGVDNQIAAWSGASSLDGDANFTWDGSVLLVGTTSVVDAQDIMSLQVTNNAQRSITFENTSNGASATAGWELENDVAIGARMFVTSSGWGASAQFLADELNLYSGGGTVNIGTGGGDIRFSDGGSEVGRIINGIPLWTGKTSAITAHPFAGVLGSYVADTNAFQLLRAHNEATGTGAATGVGCTVDSVSGAGGWISAHSTSFTEANGYEQDSFHLTASPTTAALIIQTQQAAAPIKVKINSTLVTTFDAGGMVMADAADFDFNTTTGTKIGTATAQKFAFWNATPVVQPVHIVDATGGATVDAEARTAINALLAQVATLGLQAAA